MIRINGIEIVPRKFPDGTYCLTDFPIDEVDNQAGVYDTISFVWNFESEEEIILLYYLFNHCKENFQKETKFYLYINYLPGARMDRTKSDTEVFTLKYFARLINSMDFDKVILFDPHSNVAPALFNKCQVFSAKYIVEAALHKFMDKDVVLYFPDEGAMKRYKDLFPDKRYLYGQKVRDWKTGEIQALSIKDPSMLCEEKFDGVIFMIDDICSHGGTFYYSAKELRRSYPDAQIVSYSTHTENNYPTLQKAFDEGLIEEHFTSDSLYRGDNPKITTIC